MTVGFILRLVAILFVLIAAATAFHWFGVDANYFGWVALALGAFFASFLPWPSRQR